MPLYSWQEVRIMAFTTAEAESGFDTVINKVKRTKKRIALTRRGKPVAAVVTIEDLEYLEALEAAEEAEDIKACKSAEKESMRPFSEVKKELGL
jgi:prevent-host-death family protein